MSSYSDRIAFLREKEIASKNKSSLGSFSFRSFFCGFLLASFISYLLVCQFIFKTGIHSSVNTDNSTSRLSTLRRSTPVESSTQSKSDQRSNNFLDDINSKIHGPQIVDSAKRYQNTLSELSTEWKEIIEITDISPKILGNWSHFGTNASEQNILMGNKFKSTNLVLGIAVNTNAKNFAIFCGSLRENSPDGEAIVFVNSPVAERLRLVAESTRVHIIEFDVATLEPAYMRKYHPSSIRWILFDRLLRANDGALRKAFERVILVDVRDTMFQDDPFKLIIKPTRVMIVFAEAPKVLIESCGWNSGWVKDCFGENMLTMVRRSPILCSGVSMGSMDMVADYLSKMSGVLLGQSDLGKSFPKCERNGVDQGVHNVLVHTGLLPTVSVQYEHIFPVVNLQAYPKLEASASDATLLVSYRGIKYSIVHQYDRLSSLQLALSQKYVDWVDMRDPKAEWESEVSCEGYSVAYGMDYFRGRCELGSERLMSAASCCQSCFNKNIPQPNTVNNLSVLVLSEKDMGDRKKRDYPVDTLCTSFTYLTGVCYMKKCGKSEVRAAVTDPNQDAYREDGAVSAYVRLN